jgi:membrane protein
MKKQSMSGPGVVKTLTELWQHGVYRAKEINLRTNGWLEMFVGAIRQTLRPASGISAAAISYFSLFSLFPLTLLSISVASYYLGPGVDQRLIVSKLEFIAPAMGQLLGQNIDEIIKARGAVGTLALLSLVWSASRIFYTLTQTTNEIWTNKRRRPVWKQRGMSILFVLTFVGPVLFLASLASSLFTHLRTWLPDQVDLLGNYVSFIVAIFLDIVLFMVLYIFLPHGSSTWREILPGAIGAGLFWELAKKAFLLYVSSYISASNPIYGSMATIFAFLVWAYLSGLIFLFGAHLSVSCYQHRQQQLEVAHQKL